MRGLILDWPAMTARRMKVAIEVGWVFGPIIDAQQVGAEDEILAVIERHRAANAAREALPDGVAGAEYDAAGEVEWEAFWALFAAAPTTLAGVVALLQYLAEDDQGGDRSLDSFEPATEKRRRSLFTMVR